MSWDLVFYAAPLAALLAGFLVGRGTHRGARRIRELEEEIEAGTKERELTLSELDAAKDELKRRRQEIAEYRSNVVDHFASTSRLLRDPTVIE